MSCPRKSQILVSRNRDNVLPKLWILVWALVARLVSTDCSSLVHQLPITCSPRDRLKGMAVCVVSYV